jgi:HPt (histidine-containing phosphotransfer) domain-containing protein
LAGPDSMPEAIAAAHRLAGSAATLGASRLAAMAQRFQAEARGLPPAGMLALRDRVLAVAAETRAALPAAEPRPENQAEPRPQNHAEPRRETQAEPVQDTEAEPRQDTTLA